MSLTRKIPEYRCNKIVQALQVEMICATPRGFELHYADKNFCPHEVGASWMKEFDPVPGGYVVFDGDETTYQSQQDFERDHTPHLPPKVHVCGVTCFPDDGTCNGYCVGKAECAPEVVYD